MAKDAGWTLNSSYRFPPMPSQFGQQTGQIASIEIVSGSSRTRMRQVEVVPRTIAVRTSAGVLSGVRARQQRSPSGSASTSQRPHGTGQPGIDLMHGLDRDPSGSEQLTDLAEVEIRVDKFADDRSQIRLAQGWQAQFVRDYLVGCRF